MYEQFMIHLTVCKHIRKVSKMFRGISDLLGFTEIPRSCKNVSGSQRFYQEFTVSISRSSTIANANLFDPTKNDLQYVDPTVSNIFEFVDFQNVELYEHNMLNKIMCFVDFESDLAFSNP